MPLLLVAMHLLMFANGRWNSLMKNLRTTSYGVAFSCPEWSPNLVRGWLYLRLLLRAAGTGHSRGLSLRFEQMRMKRRVVDEQR